MLASVFTRLGVLVPIGISVAFLGERPSWLQGAGIALTVAAAVVMNGLPRGGSLPARGKAAAAPAAHPAVQRLQRQHV